MPSSVEAREPGLPRQVSDYSVLRDLCRETTAQLRSMPEFCVIYVFHKYLLGT